MSLARPLSLQSRLVLLVLGFATAVWLGAAAITWRDAQSEIDTLLDGHLAQAAALLMVHAQGDYDDVSDTPVLQKFAPQVVFQIYVQGQLSTRSANAGLEPLAPLQEGFYTMQREDGVRWRVVVTQSEQPDLTVLVGERMAARQSILWALMHSLLRPLLGALPLFGLALWWSVRKGLAPLHQLRGALAQRVPQATEALPVAGLPREMEPLVQALNALLERIQRMVQNERRFTADAAHELRTPIAAIRMQAQVALGAGDDVPGRTHALQTTLAGCDRASRLVDQLLTLARLEAEPVAPTGPVDLVAVVRRVAADLAPQALSRQQTVAVQAPGPALVPASDVLLGVLVRNLLDNALRYSPDGAQVQVQVVARPEGVRLQVQDSGPGMGDADLARLGQRFFRVLGTEQTGSGLGWSIVRRLVDVFGARVDLARSATLGGLQVTVDWPVAASA